MLNNMVFDRTADDVAEKTSKGLYRYTDLNRVQDAVATIRQRFLDIGYNVTGYTLTSWSANEIPRAAKANRYLSAVRALFGVVALPENIKLPTSMNKLTYVGANNIEKFLYRMNEARDHIEAAWFYCDEVFTGEVDA